MQEKSIKKNAVFNVIKTVMGLIFPLITFPYASRILMPDGIGKVNFANSVVSYFGIIASLGIGTYGIREGAKRRNNKEEFSQFFAELFTINFISTLAAYLLLILAVAFVPKLNEYRLLIFVCSTSIMFTTVGVDWVYCSLEEYGYRTVRSIIFQFISLIALFIFVRTKEDFLQYAVIGVFSGVGSNICNLFPLRKYINLRSLKKLKLKQHLKPVFIFFGSSIAISVFTMLDTVMLGFLSTETEVGFYSAATKIVYMIRNLFPAVFTVMFPKMSILVENSRTDELKELIQKTVCLIMCLSFPMISGLYILANPMITVLSGSSYIPAVPSMYAMTPLLLLSSVSGFLGGNVLNSMGKEKTYLLCVIIGAATDFILNLILIPDFGSLGASLATLGTEAVLFVIYVILNRKFIFSKKLLKSFSKYILSTVIMTAVCLFVAGLFENMFMKLALTTITGIVVYYITLLVLKDDIMKSFMQILKNKISKRKKEI